MSLAFVFFCFTCLFFFFFSSRRRHTRCLSDWSSDVCSSDLAFERITVDPQRMGGVPCIRDLRVTVSMVLGQLAAGASSDELLADYPYLERERSEERRVGKECRTGWRGER